MKKQEAQVAEVVAEAGKRPSLRKAATTTVTAKAASKPKVEKQEAAKVAEKEATKFIPRVAVKGQSLYALDAISRPRSGRLLLAHTHAAMVVLGLFSESRPAIPKASLLTLLGERAVKYHIQKDNLESAPDHGIRLSLKGYNTFKTREVDADAAMAYQAAFLDGKVDSKVNISKGHLFQTGIL